MNVDSIFIWIFLYIHVPYGYKKLNLTIFGVIPDPIRGRIEKPSFHGIFIGGSMSVV